MLGPAWEKNLDALVEDGRAVDLVVFTGDLADWGLDAEYKTATPFFGALLGRLGLGVERLFVVPGNHDIQRKKREDVWQTLRRDLPRAPGRERSAWMAGRSAPLGITQDHRDLVLEREGAFWAWLGGEMGRPDLLPSKSAHGRLGYRSELRLPGLPFGVHIIGLDSAWMAGDDADTGKLLLTDDQAGLLATGADGGALPGFRLALIHHPLSALFDERQARDFLSEHVDLLLRGHLHEPDIVTMATPDQALRQVAAGCLYEGDMANNWPNACHLIDVSLDGAGRPSRYEMRLRGYSDRGAGFWFDDAGLSPNAPGGRLRWDVERTMSAPTGTKAGTGTDSITNTDTGTDTHTIMNTDTGTSPPLPSGRGDDALAEPPVVFVCVQKDSLDILTQLKTQVEPLVRQGLFTLWDTTQIRAGRIIKDETDAALAKARAAILLVSPGFLGDASVDAQVAALRARGTPLLCLYVTHTLAEYKEYVFQPAGSPSKQKFKLTDGQGLNSADRPLRDLSAADREGALVKAAMNLAQILREK